jgi:hypothetical protein
VRRATLLAVALAVATTAGAAPAAPPGVMKMYFEDAGKWAFMKNMGMPGSIADEISAQVRPALAAR